MLLRRYRMAVGFRWGLQAHPNLPFVSCRFKRPTQCVVMKPVPTYDAEPPLAQRRSAGIAHMEAMSKGHDDDPARAPKHRCEMDASDNRPDGLLQRSAHVGVEKRLATMGVDGEEVGAAARLHVDSPACRYPIVNERRGHAPYTSCLKGFRIARRSIVWPSCRSSEYSVAHADSRAAAMTSAS
jgi:hypothetical protein